MAYLFLTYRRAGRLCLIASTLLLALSLTACGITITTPWSKVDEAAEKRLKAVIIIPVEAEHAQRGDISSYLVTNSRIEAENRVDIVAEGVGECLVVNVEEGDFVKQGDILAELDKDETLATLRQLKVQVNQQRVEFERAQTLLASGLISPSEYDAAFFSYENGKENLKVQEVQIRNLTIRAPISGVITARNVQEGMLVSSGTPAFSLVDPKSFILVIHPPEKELARLRIGQVAEVRLDAIQGEVFSATVRRINPSVDPVRGTVKVVLDFELDVRERLRGQAYARVKLVMETRENALLIPKDAVVEENARTYLYIVREEEEPIEDPDDDDADADVSDKNDDPSPKDALVAAKVAPAEDDNTAENKGPRLAAVRVSVETGMEDDARVEIVSGLTETDLVVVNGQHTLKPGSLVKVTNPVAELEAQASLTLDEALAAAQKKREGANKRGGGGKAKHGMFIDN